MTILRPLSVEDVLTQAAQGLLAHRLRTTLSSIGIVFGVATVMAALAVGEGARREAAEQIGSLGIDNVYVRSLKQNSQKEAAAAAPRLSLADVESLRASVPGVSAVAAVRSSPVVLTAAPNRRESLLVGVTTEWAAVTRPEIVAGRWLAAEDLRQRRRVAVLGELLAHDLFGDRSPIGQRVSVGGDWFDVVGVISASGPSTSSPSPAQRFDANRIALAPLPAMDLRLGADDAIDRVEEIGLRAAGPEEVRKIEAAASAILLRRYPRAAAFEIVVPRELLRARLQTLRTFNAVLMSIGGLALLISGIGIMNIMIASVTERTAEIGVRRAFGATRAMVVAQFAIEAALLCAAGGVAGVAAGAALARVIALLAGWPVAVSTPGVIVALSMAVVVGLGFGIYPAHMAGRLDPAEALRAP